MFCRVFTFFTISEGAIMRSLVEDSSKIEDGSRVFLCSNEAFREGIVGWSPTSALYLCKSNKGVLQLHNIVHGVFSPIPFFLICVC